jgi:hypothetical protein
MQIRLPAITNQTFTRQNIVMDGRRFENCKFIECTVIYSGGPAQTSSCEFSLNTVWDFQGAAALTVMALRDFGWRIKFGESDPLDTPIQIPRA